MKNDQYEFVVSSEEYDYSYSSWISDANSLEDAYKFLKKDLGFLSCDIRFFRMGHILNESVKFFAHRLFELQNAPISINAIKMTIDKDYRTISDLISCEEHEVSHNTSYMIRNCKWWSKKAVELFNNIDDKFSKKCDFKINGKRAFTVEHEYPVGIIKNMIVNKQFNSAEEIEDHIKKYAKNIIVTLDENIYLTANSKSANTITEAETRYSKAGIEVVRFDPKTGACL